MPNPRCLYDSSFEEFIKNDENLIFGIIGFILAIIFIFFGRIVEQAIRFIIGGWILLTGILRLINVLSMNKKDSKFALDKCRSLVKKYNLNMKIIDANYTLNRDQLLFHFFFGI